MRLKLNSEWRGVRHLVEGLRIDRFGGLLLALIREVPANHLSERAHGPQVNDRLPKLRGERNLRYRRTGEAHKIVRRAKLRGGHLQAV